MFFRFPKSQIEIIRHRLDAPAALAAVLEDYFGREEVLAISEQFGKELSETSALTIISPIEIAVFIDCLHNSAFFVNCEDAITAGRITRLQLLTWQRAAKALEVVAEKLGYNIKIPRS